jgi:hypothetical protein
MKRFFLVFVLVNSPMIFGILSVLPPLIPTNGCREAQYGLPFVG